jgi:hypothetical protein
MDTSRYTSYLRTTKGLRGRATDPRSGDGSAVREFFEQHCSRAGSSTGSPDIGTF